MDNFAIREDRLLLTAIACLILASKIDGTDVNMPRFHDLTKIFNVNYTLYEFKNVETKLLKTFSFELLRPTVATFAEYFSNSFVTLADYHVYSINWHHGTLQLCSEIHLPLPLYDSYEEMLSNLNRLLFKLVDLSLTCK